MKDKTSCDDLGMGLLKCVKGFAFCLQDLENWVFNEWI